MILRVLRLRVPLQHVSDFFVTSANAALSKSDEPEKVRRSLLQNGQLMSASLQAQLPVTKHFDMHMYKTSMLQICSFLHATLWHACVDDRNERFMIFAGQETASDAVCIHPARSRGS